MIFLSYQINLKLKTGYSQRRRMMSIRERLERKLGPVTLDELFFAIEQLERNIHYQKGNLFKETCYDILAMNIEFYRKNELGGAL
jgi:hypothetical protein